MELRNAKIIGRDILEELSPFVEKIKIVGSIRRKKPMVKDIDIVILPKEEFMVLEKIKSILNRNGEMEVDGNKIIRIKSKKGISIDCYIANKKNYEVLLLIRTGSKDHNKKLASIALKQRKKLSFAEGLIDIKTKKIIANTEKGIFEALGLRYKGPEDRY